MDPRYHRQDYCAACDKLSVGHCGYFSCPFPKKESKMTREEAYNKIQGRVGDPANFLTGLELLGLIKFDAPVVDLDKHLYSYGITKDNLRNLREAGYEITKVVKHVD